MAAAPHKSDSSRRNAVSHGPMGFSSLGRQSKKATSSEEHNELQIRWEKRANEPEKPVSRTRAVKFAKYEMISRMNFSIRGEALATSAALSRTTARRWFGSDLFNTKYRVRRSTVAKRYL